MKDKIINFLDFHGINYVEEGNNVLQGNVGIACPYCLDDPSFHLGIRLQDGYFSCWRDSSHSGKKFVSLVMQLLGISYHQALSVWQEDKILVEESDFDNLFKKVVAKEEIFGKLGKLKLPDNFKSFTRIGVGKRFYDYLTNRGISPICVKYKPHGFSDILHYAIGGDWDFRIIFPIYFKGELVSWVGRSIYDDTPIKYKDTSYEECVRHPKYCLYNYDELVKVTGRRLYICEGLIDCYKLNSYLPRGDFATCLFTKTLRDEQKSLIVDIHKNFDDIRIMLDRDAEINGYKMVQDLCFLKNVSSQKIPDGFNDPAELPEYMIENL